MSGEQPPTPSPLDAVRSVAAEMRAAHRMGPPRGWHVMLPQWALRGLTWEQFCEEFEASYERRFELAHAGVIGFEIAVGGWDRPTRKYTVRRHREQEETPE